MTNRRKILLGLLVVPILLGIFSMIWPGGGLELAFLIAGVPILVLNAWEFFSPTTQAQPEETDRKNAGTGMGEWFRMKNKTLIIVVSLIVLAMLAIGIYAGIRTYVDQVSFGRALSLFLIKLADKLWNLFSQPAIFIALLALIFLWPLRRWFGSLAQKAEDRR